MPNDDAFVRQYAQLRSDAAQGRAALGEGPRPAPDLSLHLSEKVQQQREEYQQRREQAQARRDQIALNKRMAWEAQVREFEGQRVEANTQGRVETPDARIQRMAHWSVVDQKKEFKGTCAAAMSELDRQVLELRIARKFFAAQKTQAEFEKLAEQLKVKTTYGSKPSLVKMARAVGIFPALAAKLPPVWWQLLVKEIRLIEQNPNKFKQLEKITAHALDARQLGPIGSGEEDWAQFDVTTAKGIKLACGKISVASPVDAPGTFNKKPGLIVHVLATASAAILGAPHISYCKSCLKRFKKF